MGRDRRQTQLDRLIREVSRGERQLGSIRDEQLREAVRVALRLHKDSPAAPDAYTRARMRARVLAGLRPRRDNAWTALRDNAWTALELLARPAPYIVRGFALGSVLVTLGMAAVVASADTLPDDLLYPVKIATEQMRLALADAPADRAGVELSIAEHRLSEAEKLAGYGRTSDALVASAMFSQHIASAAAELAPQSDTDLGLQLESAFNAERQRATALADTLATEVKTARGAQVLALLAAPTVPGATRLESVAETAASLAGVLADAADVAAAENAVIATPPPSGTATRSETPPAVFVPRFEIPRASQTQQENATAASGATTTPTARAATPTAGAATPTAPAATATARAATTTTALVRTEAPAPAAAQTRDPRAADAAKIAREAATNARAAADKLKQTLKDQHR